MHASLAFIIAIWAFIACLALFFIFLGLSLVRASSEIQLTIAVAAAAILSILTFRLYRGIKANLTKAKTGREVLIGAKGIAVTDLTPKGIVRVKGEFWQAIAKENFIEKDRELEVVGIAGLVLEVKLAQTENIRV